MFIQGEAENKFACNWNFQPANLWPRVCALAAGMENAKAVGRVFEMCITNPASFLPCVTAGSVYIIYLMYDCIIRVLNSACHNLQRSFFVSHVLFAVAITPA